MNLARIFLTLVCSAALMLVSGCATSNRLVPKSVIHVTDAQGKKFSIELPKDLDAESIEFTRLAAGDISFTIKKIKVRTNPEVIGAAGLAQSDAIKAGGNIALEGFKLGLDAAKTGAVKTVVP